MRKQYHLRPSDAGLRAWDVDRLICLSKGFIVREVALSEIREIDEPFWVLSGGPPPACREIVEHTKLIEEAALQFPIILSADGRLMDGMHRVAKALPKMQSHIKAVQFRTDPEPDYVGVDPDDLPY